MLGRRDDRRMRIRLGNHGQLGLVVTVGNVGSAWIAFNPRLRSSSKDVLLPAVLCVWHKRQFPGISFFGRSVWSAPPRLDSTGCIFFDASGALIFSNLFGLRYPNAESRGGREESRDCAALVQERWRCESCQGTLQSASPLQHDWTEISEGLEIGWHRARRGVDQRHETSQVSKADQQRTSKFIRQP